MVLTPLLIKCHLHASPAVLLLFRPQHSKPSRLHHQHRTCRFHCAWEIFVSGHMGRASNSEGDPSISLHTNQDVPLNRSGSLRLGAPLVGSSVFLALSQSLFLLIHEFLRTHCWNIQASLILCFLFYDSECYFLPPTPVSGQQSCWFCLSCFAWLFFSLQQFGRLSFLLISLSNGIY